MSIELGRWYKDKVSGFVGIAVHRTEFLHACERVCLQMTAKDGEIKEGVFDAPQLEAVKNRKAYVPTIERAALTGGDRPGVTRPRSLSR